MEKKRQRFSLRKNKIGVVSVLVGLAFASGVGATSVSANETATTTPTETVATASTTPVEATTTPESAATNETVSAANKAEEATTVDSKDEKVATTTTPEAPKEGQKVDVRILATTDLHTNLVNYDYYQDKPAENIGLAKTAVLIEEAKKENSNVVLVDNGDTIQGTPLGTYKAIVNPIKDGEQHPMYTALQKLGFDVGTLGNHEFNYGLDYLKKVIDTAGMPIVNANIVDAKTGKFVYDPFKIITKTFKDTTGKAVNVNIGITGIVPPQILSWDKANLEGKILVNDSVEAVEAIIPEMRKAGADVVLVLSHSGIGDDVYEKGEENEGYQIASIKGVDAVVTGHSHAEFPSGNGTGFYEKYKGVDGVNGKINGTPVTMAGKYGDHLGIIDLNLLFKDGKWTVEESKGFIRKIDTKSNVADERIKEIAKEAHEGTVKYVRQQVGTTTAPITSYFALVKDDPSVQIVNNAQLWYAKKELAGTPEGNLPILSAAAPFKAGTRGDATAYTDIPAGAIAIKNVADLYLYDNVTAILKVTGAQLKEWLEMSAGQFNTIDPNKKEAQEIVNSRYRTYNFDVIDGVTYEFDVTQPNKYDRDGKEVNPNASRVRNLKYQGKEVKPDQEFIVVTNNYRANGQFPGVREASLNKLLGLENRQAIINYIIEEKTINPSADGNWRFADTIKGLDIRFLTASKAKDLVGKDGDVVYLSESSQDGFSEYKLVYVAPKEVKELEKLVEEAKKQIDDDATLTEDQKAKLKEVISNATVKDQLSTTVNGKEIAVTLDNSKLNAEKLVVNELTGKDAKKVIDVVEKNLENKEVVTTYDIHLEDAAGKVLANNGQTRTVTVALVKADNENLEVYYVNGEKLEKVPSIYKDGRLTFFTDHFSVYTIIKNKTQQQQQRPQNDARPQREGAQASEKDSTHASKNKEGRILPKTSATSSQTTLGLVALVSAAVATRLRRKAN